MSIFLPSNIYLLGLSNYFPYSLKDMITTKDSLFNDSFNKNRLAIKSFNGQLIIGIEKREKYN